MSFLNNITSYLPKSLQNILPCSEKQKKQKADSFCKTCNSIFDSQNEIDLKIHQFHRIMEEQECQIRQSLSVFLKIAQENAFQIFDAFNSKVFPSLKELNLQFSGNMFSWVEYKPNPLENMMIWEKSNIEQLKYDLSEINMNEQWLLVLFRGFENLSSTLKSLDLCFWNKLGEYDYLSGGTNNWITEQNIYEQNISFKYTRCLYYAIISVTTIGYGDISPQNLVESLFVSVMAIVAPVIFAYIINQVQQIMFEIKQRTYEYHQKLAEMNLLMNQRNVNQNLQHQARNYLDYVYSSGLKNNLKVDQTLEFLSVQLKETITKEIFMNKINNIQILKNNFSQRFLEQLALKVKEKSFGPDEILFNRNEINEPNFYIVQKGFIEVFIQHGSITSTEYKQFEVFKSGQVFGVNEFFKNLQSYDYSCKSLGVSQIQYFSYKDFYALLKEFPRDLEIFSIIKENLIYQNYFMPLNLKCYSCKSASHLIKDCRYIYYNPNNEQLINKYQKEINLYIKNFKRDPNKTKTTNARLIQLELEDELQYFYEDNEYLLAEMFWNNEDDDDDNDEIEEQLTDNEQQQQIQQQSLKSFTGSSNQYDQNSSIGNYPSNMKNNIDKVQTKKKKSVDIHQQIRIYQKNMQKYPIQSSQELQKQQSIEKDKTKHVKRVSLANLIRKRTSTSIALTESQLKIQSQEVLNLRDNEFDDFQKKERKSIQLGENALQIIQKKQNHNKPQKFQTEEINQNLSFQVLDQLEIIQKTLEKQQQKLNQMSQKKIQNKSQITPPESPKMDGQKNQYNLQFQNQVQNINQNQNNKTQPKDNSHYQVSQNQLSSIVQINSQYKLNQQQLNKNELNILNSQDDPMDFFDLQHTFKYYFPYYNYNQVIKRINDHNLLMYLKSIKRKKTLMLRQKTAVVQKNKHKTNIIK